jgi:hypothetical protein
MNNLNLTRALIATLLVMLGTLIGVGGTWATCYLGHICYNNWPWQDAGWAWYLIPEFLTVCTTLAAGTLIIVLGVRYGTGKGKTN